MYPFHRERSSVQLIGIVTIESSDLLSTLELNESSNCLIGTLRVDWKEVHPSGKGDPNQNGVLLTIKSLDVFGTEDHMVGSDQVTKLAPFHFGGWIMSSESGRCGFAIRTALTEGVLGVVSEEMFDVSRFSLKTRDCCLMMILINHIDLAGLHEF